MTSIRIYHCRRRLALLFGLSLLTASQLCLAQADSGCAVGKWSTPRAVTGLGAQRSDNISLSVGAHETVISGSPELMFRGDTTAASRSSSLRGAWLRVVALSGEPLPALAGDFFFVDPRIAVDSHDRVHVVWGEPAPGTDATGSPSLSALDVVSLWHAMWSNGAWTRPTMIRQAKRIAWNRNQSSRLVVDRRDGLNVTVPIETEDLGAGVEYLHFDTRSWSSHLIVAPAHVHAVYTDVASLPDGRIVVAFVAAGVGTLEAPNVNALFTTTSVDDGISWSPLQTTTRAQTPAYWPRMTVDASGRLHFVWVQLRYGGTGSDALWHAASIDGGRSWTAATPLPLDREVRYPSIATDAAGVLHVAVQYQTPSGPNILYGCVEHGEWTPLVEPFEGTVNRAPLLWRGADQRIHLIRYQAPAVANWPMYYRLVSAVLETDCSRAR